MAIAYHLGDADEDFYIVEEGDVEDFETLDLKQNLELVATIGEFRIYRDHAIAPDGRTTS